MTNQIDEIMRLALAYRMADTVDLWPTECDLRKAVEAALKPGLPDGWVPCTITYEDQYPEEVAYGPQRLMDRLKKWLDRYFAIRAEQAALKPGEPKCVAIIDVHDLSWHMEYLSLPVGKHRLYDQHYTYTAPPAQTLCHCKDRPASECPGEWEPGCDLGNNEAHAVAATKSAESAQHSAQMASAWAKVQTDAVAALEEPEQSEPVAHCRVRPLQGDESTPKVFVQWVKQPVPGPLFAAPPRREPLTEGEIRSHAYAVDRKGGSVIDLARAVEAAHGIGVKP